MCYIWTAASSELDASAVTVRGLFVDIEVAKACSCRRTSRWTMCAPVAETQGEVATVCNGHKTEVRNCQCVLWSSNMAVDVAKVCM